MGLFSSVVFRCSRKPAYFAVAVWLLLFCIDAVAHPKSEKHFNLSNTAWRLIEFESNNDEIGRQSPSGDSQYTIKFNKDGSLELRLDCNTAKGNWRAEAAPGGLSGTLEIGPVASTRMRCPPPSMGDQIARHAQYITSYLFQNGHLYLSLMADAGTYAWEPLQSDASATKMVAPEQGGPRNWALRGVTSFLNMRAKPSLNSEVVSRLRADSILDNLGCSEGEDRIWCYVQRLGGGPVGYVAGDFLTPAISPDGAVSSGPDNSSLRAGQGDFDATGVLPCAISQSQPMTQCQFGVARAGGGYATVVVYKSDNRTRSIYFRMGVAIGAATSQAEGYPSFNAVQHGDLNRIEVGEERYEIPYAVIFGG